MTTEKHRNAGYILFPKNRRDPLPWSFITPCIFPHLYQFLSRNKPEQPKPNKQNPNHKYCMFHVHTCTVALLDAAVLWMRNMDCTAIRLFLHLLTYDKCLFRPLWQVHTSGNLRELSSKEISTEKINLLSALRKKSSESYMLNSKKMSCMLRPLNSLFF